MLDVGRRRDVMSYQCLMISSLSICEWLYLIILATAEIAFSVALRFSTERDSGSATSAASSGAARAQAGANCTPPNCASTPQPYAAACRTSASGSRRPFNIGSRNMSWYFTHAGPAKFAYYKIHFDINPHKNPFWIFNHKLISKFRFIENQGN